jgi:hypothetical protein
MNYEFTAQSLKTDSALSTILIDVIFLQSIV